MAAGSARRSRRWYADVRVCASEGYEFTASYLPATGITLGHTARDASTSPHLLVMVNLSTLRLLPPPLVGSAYKGQAGKVGVLGGCAEYTG